MRQTVILVGIYLVVMAGLTMWMPAWHEWDLKFFQRISASRTSLSPDIKLVDDQSVDVPAKRRIMLAAFLEELAASKQRPYGLILDYDFGPCLGTCGAEIASVNAALVKALQSAAKAGIKVYANANVPRDKDDNVTGPLEQEDTRIYSGLADVGHNHFYIDPTSSRFAFFRPCYAPGNGLAVDVWAAVLRVLRDFDEKYASHGCVAYAQPHPVPGGASLPHVPADYAITNANPFPAHSDFIDKYVIVGTLKFDQPPGSDIKGPELVARALSGELQWPQPFSYYAPPAAAKLYILIPAFSIITVLAFAACFFLTRRLQLRAARRFLPWIAAAAAVCIGFAALVAFEFIQIQPQVTLISLGMLLSAGFCGVRGKQIEFEQQMKIDIVPDEKCDYDVFISYAHDEGAWVAENVYAPLRDARLPGGRKLSVFFDTSTIRVGTAWQDKIALAIEGSRFIVPVYSEVYFQKPYCRFEIKRAHRKWIGAGEQSRCVLPVMRGHPKILAVVDDIQALSFDDEPSIMKMIVTEILARISPETQDVSHSSP